MIGKGMIALPPSNFAAIVHMEHSQTSTMHVCDAENV